MKLRPQTTEEKNKSSGGFKERRQQCLDALKNIPTVNIKGKKYSTVNERHKHLLQYFPEARFNEEILFHDADRVIVKVELYISDVIYSVGHAEEFRNSSFINKTSALENAATSSLGRCISQFGLHGSEYASADELTVALLSQGVSQSKVSIKDKINQQTTETKLNKLYSDWEKENDSVKKSFQEKQKSIKTNGGQNAKNW